MEVTVTHTPTGRSCVVGVADTATVLDLKTDALQQLFAGSDGDLTTACAPPQPADLVVRMDGSGGDWHDLDDTQRVADTPLESGSAVQLARRCDTVKAPFQYPIPHAISCVAFSPCGTMCCAGTESGMLFAFDIYTAEPVAEATTQESVNIMCIAYSRCGKWLAACSEDGPLYIWCTSRWEMVHCLEGHSWDACTAAWTHCGRLVSGSGDNDVRVWDIKDGVGQCASVLQGHAKGVTGVAVSHTSIFSASSDKSIRVWDLATLTHKHTLGGHTGPISHIAITTDGETLVSCSWDMTLKVWCTAALSCLRTVKAHRIPGQISVSQEGAIMAATLDDPLGDCTKLWSLSSGRHVGTLWHRETSSSAVPTALSRCGRWLLTTREHLLCVSAVETLKAQGVHPEGL